MIGQGEAKMTTWQSHVVVYLGCGHSSGWRYSVALNPELFFSFVNFEPKFLAQQDDGCQIMFSEATFNWVSYA